MTGLNPDGLGVSRTFNVTNTERVSLNGPVSEGAYPILSEYIIHANGKYWHVPPSTSDADAGSNLETAISDLSNRYDWVYVPPRVYEANIVIEDVVNPTVWSLGLQSCLIDGGTTGHAVEIVTDSAGSGSKRTHLRNIQAKTTPGGGNPYDAIHISGDGNRVSLDVYIAASDRHGVYIEDAVNDVRGTIVTTGNSAEIDDRAVYNDYSDNNLHVWARAQSVEHGPNTGLSSCMYVYTESTSLVTTGAGRFFDPHKHLFLDGNGNLKVGDDVPGRVDFPNGWNLGSNADINGQTLEGFAVGATPGDGSTIVDYIPIEDTGGTTYYLAVYQ